MDILLINPSTELYSKVSYNREPPAGLLSIAMYLRINGLDVKVVDAKDKELLNLYLKLEPKLIGITCLTNTYNEAICICREIKELLPNSKIVMGGPHATFTWREILKSVPTIDYIIRGEGEYPLLDLFQTLDDDNKISKIGGLAYRSNDKIIDNGLAPIFDMNLFPFPDRIDIIPNKYDVASIIVNRGCPYNCSFCVRQKLFQNVRFKEPINVIKEMENVDNLGYSFVNMYDNINIDQQISRKICTLITEKISELEIPWGAELRGDKLSYESAKLMSEAGCKVVAIGVETSSKKILELNGKYQAAESVKKGIENAKKAGLAVQCYFIIGLPGETNETFRATIDFLESLPLIQGEDRINFFVATPYPGSRLYEKGENQLDIKIIDKNWDNYDTEHVIFETEYLTKEKIEDLFTFAKKYEKSFNF
ncbi:MAG: B12-binding domain-containing radical SAM protein [Promethearchaeota archaeon]|nr:MAG: B12-binding domain-containing radical SAM protein [Candidatus Lokiarchaeota archaeon]